MRKKYPFLTISLPKTIYFITSQELEDMFPDKTPKEREELIVRDKKAVFIIGIGDKLKSGIPHDLRSPDYDDWSLDGDLIVYDKVLDKAIELSSMGIRVDEDALLRQLKIRGKEENASLPFQKALLDGKLPYTIGGGIGQSRICMYFLRKAHVGEVQASVWPPEVLEECKKHGVNIL